MPRSPPRPTRTRSTPTTSTSCAPRGSPGSPSGCRASDRTCSPPWIAPIPLAGHSSAWRGRGPPGLPTSTSVSYTHLRAHETPEHLVCRLLLEKKKKNKNQQSSKKKQGNKQNKHKQQKKQT